MRGKVGIQSMLYLQVQMENVHLMHVSYSLTYLLDEQDGIKLSQTVVVINDPVKQLTSIHTVEERGVES